MLHRTGGRYTSASKSQQNRRFTPYVRCLASNKLRNHAIQDRMGSVPPLVLPNLYTYGVRRRCNRYSSIRTPYSHTQRSPLWLDSSWTAAAFFVSRGLCSSSNRAAPIIQLPWNMVPPRLCCPPITDLSVPLHVGSIISPVEKFNLNSSEHANRE